MRKLIEKQLKISQVDISRITINLECRDEIPQLLLGLQTLYSDRQLRDNVFAILENIIPENIDTRNGRPGMDLWKILVLGTLRLNCNWDYDKLHEIANNHKTVREFLGHTIFEFDQSYSLQALKDNVALLTPEILDQISTLVIGKGHSLCGCAQKQPLKGRCDSFVVETDVHYPTDINLLWDAVRKVVSLTAGHCDELGVTEWRQGKYILCKIKRLFNRVRKLKRSSARSQRQWAKREQANLAAHQVYVSVVESYVHKARQTLGILSELGLGQVARRLLIEHFIGHAERQIEQIRRRVLADEKIPHGQKVFSLFEPHTEWISKGKAGVPQELGLKVCVLEDQNGFLLHHHVMQGQSDDQAAVLMVAEAKKKFAALGSCSFDKGFHSPENQERLQKLLTQVVLPRKGRRSAQVQAIEGSAEFIAARRRHAAVESAINALENHGLDRCPDHGITGFKRYVALAVLARNLQILGVKVREKALKRLRRKPPAVSSMYPLAA
jgi:hypothetical protein